MTPNLYVATQALLTPHKWFSRKRTEKAGFHIEHWESPMPGVYEYRPGRGWYLIQPDSNPDDKVIEEKSFTPQPVCYSRVLKRYLFKEEIDKRSEMGLIATPDGRTKELGFFRLDDGVAWVNCWDEHGHFIPGPYERWCFDKVSKRFRKMLKGDCPQWQSRHSSRNSSRNNSRQSSIRTPSIAGSLAPSIQQSSTLEQTVRGSEDTSRSKSFQSLGTTTPQVKRSRSSSI